MSDGTQSWYSPGAIEQAVQAQNRHADIRDRADEWLTKVNAWHPDVRVVAKPVDGRVVRCEVPGCTRFDAGDVAYGDRVGGGHGHWTPYETPHERIVIVLPVEESP